ncbi:MAG: alanine racemase, partial [Angustibacter sp.]
SVVVLSPWLLPELAAGSPDRLIRTVSSLPVLREVAQTSPSTPIIIELDSPMHRHGITDLEPVRELLPRLHCRGFASHLPPIGDRLAATRRTLAALAAAGITPGTLWISHLAPADLARVRAENPELTLRPRVGTDLWLGSRRSLTARGQVLDAHPTATGTPVGYRQRRVGRGGTLIVVSGGTAHGVGLRSAASGGAVARLRGLAVDLLHSTNHPPSPFHWQGQRLRYADVPHMQVSMLLVPPRLSPPPIGEWLACDVRLTVSTFDGVELSAIADIGDPR